MPPLRVLVVGCGNMGASHARAYRSLGDFELVGLCSRQPHSRERLAAALGGVPTYPSAARAIAELRPDAVSINTWPDSHAELALSSLAGGAHVFLEKPLATTEAAARAVIAAARQHRRKLVVGYILRVHPAWQRFIELARGLGKPLVMRMNLNQQSSGAQWETHKNLMTSMSPIVDCGVHYVDVMCQMTRAAPLRVSAIGARLSDEIAPDMYNYGQLQVVFADGSVGWYESGWGPMISETAYFVKDVIGPRGSVSIVDRSDGAERERSAEIGTHTATRRLRVHHASRDGRGERARADELLDTSDEPDHDTLCRLEQEYFLRAIRDDLDLTEHQDDALRSLCIVLAADASVRRGETVVLRP